MYGLWPGSPPSHEPRHFTTDGMSGGKISVNAVNCAPCHLPGIDGTIRLGMVPVPKEAPCGICHLASGFKDMIMCDGCDGPYHLACLRPPLKNAPVEAWYCPGCQDRQARGEALPEQIRETDEDRANAVLDGVRVRRPRDKLTGTARYLGSLVGVDCFEATYPDGSAERLTARQVRSRRL